MIYDAENDEFVLASGRRLYSVMGTTGLSEDMQAAYGSDGRLGDSDGLSQEERMEIADYMISLWTKYKEVLP